MARECLPARTHPGRWLRRIQNALAALVLALAADAANGDPEPPRDLNRRLVFASSEVSFPYQYRDRDGQLKGFANEVADAVARQMSLPITRVAVATTAMADALRNGRVDVIQFWSETEERHQWADFSVPIVRFETVIVVRKGDRRIQRIADLKGKRVAIGQRGTVGHRFLVNEQPDAIPVYTETTEEFLRMLSAGTVDAAAMSRLTAVSMIERLGLRNLWVLPERIPGESYDVRYCFTVRKGDSLLLARLNEGLAVIHRTGEFDEIYRRWFGRYEQRTFTRLELVSYVAAALALACAAVTWGLIRQRVLRRRVAQQAAELAEQRSLLAALYDKHPLATVIIEVSPEGTPLLVSANPEAIRLFGMDPKRPLPSAITQLGLSQDALEYVEDAIRRWRALGEATQWEARYRNSQRVVEAVLVPLGRNLHGVMRLCVLTNDVTQRRLVDYELAQSRRLRALGELVGGIAHEFNNLLTPIIMTTSQARLQRSLSPQLEADFTVIDNAARRAADLTRRLLTFGRKSDERPQPVVLREIVENCFSLLRPTVDRRVQWSLVAPPELPPLVANPTDLNQIVFNLVINARDTLLEKLHRPPDDQWTPRLDVVIEEIPTGSFTPDLRRATSGKVERPSFLPPPTASPLSWQRFTVIDNGQGIPSEITDRIFEPFFTTKQIGQGTGLGLATVWHLVNDLGGDINVDSRLGEGTRFSVTLPRWPAITDAAEGAGAPVTPRASVRGLRILLAEDDPLVTRTALAVLERANHVVTHCADGSEAWSRLVDTGAHFDVLLLDLNMPRLNGTDLIRRIRRGVFNGAIAVMSGRVTDEERQALTELAVDRIITKPFGASDLIDAVRELASKRPNR